MGTTSRSSLWPNWASATGLLLVNTALFSAGIFNLIVGCWHALQAHETMAITCLVAGLLLLLASSIDRFELLKGFGIEAKTRALDKVLDEADSTLDHLRQLAEVTSESIMQLSSSAGRTGSAPGIRESTARAHMVRENLIKLKVDPEKVREILQPWVRITLFVATQPLVTAIEEALRQVHIAKTTEAEALPKPRTDKDEERFRILIGEGNWALEFFHTQVGSPWQWAPGTCAQKFTEILRSMPVATEGMRIKLQTLINPWIPRLDHFEQTQDLLQPEVWYAVEVR